MRQNHFVEFRFRERFKHGNVSLRLWIRLRVHLE